MRRRIISLLCARVAAREGPACEMFYFHFTGVRDGTSVSSQAPMVGHHVSHANNKTKRRFMPNLQYRRFWVESENRWVRLRLTTAGLRTVDKIGIDAVLADLRARGEI